jgi:hypothetical protein
VHRGQALDRLNPITILSAAERRHTETRMTIWRWSTICGLGLGLASLAGCGDPADRFMARMERSDPAQRPPDWENTKRLMARPAPKTGDVAPDFTLKTVDGGTNVVRSQFAAGRPLVLVFGSFT